MSKNIKHTTRRRFLKTSAATAALGSMAVGRAAHAAGSDVVRIALIGCGGRGTNAAVQAINNQGGVKVKLTAAADAFADRLDRSMKSIETRCKDNFDVPPERRFIGLDAYKKAIASDVDMVLLTTPPGFRPAQFEAAVDAGKHVFMEKPVAVDGPGVRKVLEANERAKKKGLVVAVGHHLRHEKKHTELIAKIHDGAIGELKYMRAYFNSGGVWVRPRKPGQTEMEFQVRNWYYFNWTGGDHIVEQHVHDLDVCNWIADAYPVEASGYGGRQVRKGKDVGEIFDHHAVEFTYADGVKMFSYCRHIPGCWNSFSEHANGTKGFATMQGHGNTSLEVDGQEPIKWRRRGLGGHLTEHNHLFAAMAAGKPYNEADYGAKSTLTAIMGRMATYSGKIVTWEDALNSKLDLMPERLAFDAEAPVQPDADGTYPCAMPGLTKAF